MKKRYLQKLNFSKAEFSTLTLGNSGAVLDKPETLEAILAKVKESESKGDKAPKGLSFQSALRTQNIPENVQINPAEMLVVPCRLLSATIVGGGTWKATDFSQNGVLRQSMPLLQGKPVYRNHDIDPDSWLGLVQELEWGETYVQNGLAIPAGINGMLAIDTSIRENADLAKGIVMGAVRSNSVTIEFEWEPSHDFPNEWSFWELIGEVVDGRMVTRVVTRILDYHETSIVGLGADPFAKMIDQSGNLVDVDLAGSDGLPVKMYSDPEGNRLEYSKQVKSAGSFFVDCAEDNQILNLSKTETNVAKNENGSYGKGFGTKLSEYVDQFAANNELKRGEVIAKLAESAGVSNRTVELYISGSQACPSANYVTAWAKTLLVDSKEFVKLLEADGCSYSDAETLSMLEGNALDSNKASEDDDKDEEEEMNKEVATNDKVEGDDVAALMAELKAMQDKLAKVMDSKATPKDLIEETLNAAKDEQKAIELAKQAKEIEDAKAELAKAEAESKAELAKAETDAKIEIAKAEADKMESKVADAKAELEKLESEGKSQIGELAETYKKVIKDLEGTVDYFKKEMAEIKQDADAQKLAFKDVKRKDLETLTKLRAEVESEKAKVLILSGEKKALELNKDTIEDIMVELQLTKSKIDDYEIESEKTKEVAHFTEIGRLHFAKLKKEAVRLYRAALGEKSSDAVIQLFEQSQSLEQIEGLVAQYGKQLGDEFHFRCKGCGSNSFEFSSTIAVNEEKDFSVSSPMTDDQIRSGFMDIK